MGMTQWIRRYAITSRQKRLAHNKRFHSFDTAKTVGLVFKLDKDDVPPIVSATTKFLKGKGINVSLIGYYEGNILPESVAQASSAIIFTKKELNWYGRPISENVNRFLLQGYDIVIDFCREAEVYPIQYIVSSVEASMIIGGVQYARCPYDLIIDAQKVCNAEGYMEQIKHYLSVINNPQNVEQQTTY